MPLDRDQFNQFIDLMSDFVTTEPDRETLIQRAFYGEPIIGAVDYSGRSVGFTSNCIARLESYNGDTALVQLLETLRDHYLGDDRKPEAQTLIDDLQGGTSVGEEKQSYTASGKPVFISYSRQNMDFVNRLRADLDKHGIAYWIDKVGLVPGTADWENGLRTAIANANGVVLVATPSSRQSAYVRDEIAIARMKNKQVLPVWAAGDEWMDAIPMGMGYVQKIDMRGSAYASGLQQLVDVLGGQSTDIGLDEDEQPPAPVENPDNPFKGLYAFEETDADLFFGREALVTQFVKRIEKQLADKQARFLAVLGPSGAGKSSVAMAGVIPALKRQYPEWTYLPKIVPSTHPIEHLADALKAAMPDTPLSSIEADLNAPGGRMLHRLARQLPGERAVLYIDQFEELFTLTASENERAQFISLISQSVSETDGKLLVLVSMRADFLDRPLGYPLLGDLFDQYNALVRPMSIAELRDAIVKPTRLPNVGLTFDDGLVEEIIYALRTRDEKAQAGALPLLQFTLERLFEERDGNRLTWDAYQQMGGVSGAIGTHSENIFQQLPKVIQEKLGTVFIHLVSINESTGEPTRRRALLDNLITDPSSKILVNLFVNNGLMQTGRDGNSSYLEVAHEALFEHWEHLKSWIEVIREDLILLKQLRTATVEWQRNGRPDYLKWPQERLTFVYEMRSRIQPSLSDIEIEFIEPEIPRLLDLLHEGTTEKHTYGYALTRLNEMGPIATKDLIHKLQHVEGKINQDICAILIHRQSADGVAAVAKYAVSENLRIRSIHILASLDKSKLIEIAQSLLRGTEYPTLRKNLIVLLAKADSVAAINLLHYVSRNDRDLDLRKEAINKLVILDKYLSEEILEDIIRSESESEVQVHALTKLASINQHKTIAISCDILREKTTLEALPPESILEIDYEMGEQFETSNLTPSLHKVMTDLLISFGEIALDQLIDLVGESNVVREIIVSIGSVCVPRLLTLMTHSDINIKNEAAYLIARITYQADFELRTYLDDLLRILTATDSSVVKMHILAMLRVTDDLDVIPFICTRIHDVDPIVRRSAAKAMSIFSGTQESTYMEELATVCESLGSEITDDRIEAAELLAIVQDPRATVALCNALEDESVQVRIMASQALISIADTKSLNPLVKSLRDSSDQVKQNAIEALTSIGDHSVIKEFIVLAEDYNNNISFSSSMGIKKIIERSSNPNVVLKQFSQRLLDLAAKGTSAAYLIAQMLMKNSSQIIDDIIEAAEGGSAVAVWMVVDNHSYVENGETRQKIRETKGYKLYSYYKESAEENKFDWVHTDLIDRVGEKRPLSLSYGVRAYLFTEYCLEDSRR